MQYRDENRDQWMADVSRLIRETMRLVDQRGLAISSAKVSRLTRRYLREGGSASDWAERLAGTDAIVIADIAAAERFVQSICIVPGGLPGLGKRR